MVARWTFDFFVDTFGESSYWRDVRGKLMRLRDLNRLSWCWTEVERGLPIVEDRYEGIFRGSG